ncbi:DUF4112 domain-containing protein [Asticcacaulis sp. EMRT-3]|uniref:DUF4112 domain-containing protein n=1 Tax=Asticcacaulis sp. EMRT-3 TaxID=3040349 RepID=UPI0024AFB7ED|nr:DUF4112 domain-containing protein [Asticcacaulis sp. EMRT-3]MDI7774986.1 DUF4112 domain-containing protein [Asticcacaulis sp. EMRT-3]
MLARTHGDILKIYDSVDTVKRLSDRIIGIGPINIIGLDGILSWFPGIGIIYSVGASLFLLGQGLRARVSPTTLGFSLIILIANDLPEAFALLPVIGEMGALINTLFQGHLYAAHIIQKDIDRTIYIETSAAHARRSGSHTQNVAALRATKGKKRIVYLG